MSRRAGTPAPRALLLGAIALVPALVLFTLWRWAAGRAEGADPPPPTPSTVVAPGPPVAPLSTPVLSWRRVPGLVARDVNLEAFQAAVTGFAGQLNDTSCVSVSLDGVPVGARHPDLALIPASNQKLLTGAVALEVLGPDHVYATELRGPAPTGGVIAGDVYLVGGGDPLLTSSTYPVRHDRYPVASPTSLDALVDGLVAAGVTRITGAVRGDGSRYDDEFFAPSWSTDVHVVEAGPYDALLVNDARQTGDEFKAADPAEGAARELVQVLAARGIAVDGGAGAGATPSDAGVLASVTSAPMSAVVEEMLGASDNNTAEMLVKELGFVAGGAGTRDAGLAVMERTLGSWGLSGFQLADGSGLSNDNRVSCAVLAAVLGRHGPDDGLGAGLPVAGESGTLVDVFTDSPVAGRLRAKTGTLGNPPYNADPPAAKSLSGYLPVGGGGTIAFALILNGTGALADQGVYRPIWDAFAATLAAYPAGPGPGDLAPR